MTSSVILYPLDSFMKIRNSGGMNEDTIMIIRIAKVNAIPRDLAMDLISALKLYCFSILQCGVNELLY